MNIFKNSHFFFRFGLAFGFFWAGISSFLAPEEWASYLPGFVGSMMPLEVALYMHATLEIIVGLAILFEILPKITYGLATLMLIGILVFVGLDDVTFRDVGLACLALGLWLGALKDKPAA